MFICDKIANYIAKTDWSLRRHLPKIILLLNLGKIIALDWAYFVHTYLQRVPVIFSLETQTKFFKI